jgi:hypothetical protein
MTLDFNRDAILEDFFKKVLSDRLMAHYYCAPDGRRWRIKLEPEDDKPKEHPMKIESAIKTKKEQMASAPWLENNLFSRREADKTLLRVTEAWVKLYAANRKRQLTWGTQDLMCPSAIIEEMDQLLNPAPPATTIERVRKEILREDSLDPTIIDGFHRGILTWRQAELLRFLDQLEREEKDHDAR